VISSVHLNYAQNPYLIFWYRCHF